MTAKPENGIAVFRSHHSVDQTVGKLEEILPGSNSPHEPFAQRGA